jgi:hypothetical protein
MENYERAMVLLHDALILLTNISGSVKNIVSHIELAQDPVDVTEIIFKTSETIEKTADDFKSEVLKLCLNKTS